MNNIKFKQNIINNDYDIVVVDSGVNLDNVNCLEIIKKNGKYIFSDNSHDSILHGTSIVNILNKEIPLNKILMIKIFDGKELKHDENLICYVLNFINEHISCKIINLSFGIPYITSNRLYKICNKLNKSGKIILSAFDNDNSISFPAFFRNVIGVYFDKSINNKNEFVYLENNPHINVFCCGNFQRIDNNGARSMIKGTSYACANFAVILYKLIKNYNYLSFDSLNRLLIENAKKKLIFPIFKAKPNRNLFKEKINYAVIFPFNKENQNLLRFNSILPFSIVDIYDIPISGKVGMSVNDRYDIQGNKNYVIKNIKNLDFDTFDLLIIGHLNKYMNNDMIINLIQECIKKGKKIYSYDIFDITNKNIYYPEYISDESTKYNLGKLFYISSPIVLVAGTGSKEGKTTLQIKMKLFFEGLSYKVGFLGTEPNSILLGSDAIIHYGFNSQYLYKNEMFDFICNVNSKLHQIDNKNVDLIITGLQSIVLQKEINNTIDIPIENYFFLLGANPDVFVLNINFYDECEYILRCINYIRSLTSSTLVGIVIFPLKNPDIPTSIIKKEERIQKMIDLKKFIDYPIAFLDDETALNEVFKNIINIFSK